MASAPLRPSLALAHWSWRFPRRQRRCCSATPERSWQSDGMTKGRLEAFTDGVIAILITIMVLELRPPEGSSLSDLHPLVPTLLTYVLSFVMLAIYWNNHHHMLQVVEHIDGLVLWANMFLLFWLSLVPFTTAWIGEHPRKRHRRHRGGVVLGAAIATSLLTRALCPPPRAGSAWPSPSAGIRRESRPSRTPWPSRSRWCRPRCRSHLHRGGHRLARPRPPGWHGCRRSRPGPDDGPADGLTGAPS